MQQRTIGVCHLVVSVDLEAMLMCCLPLPDVYALYSISKAK